MRKIKLLFAAMLCIVGIGKMNAEVVTAASQLSNTKVYTIKTERGYMTLNTAQTTIVSSHKSNGGTVNEDAATDDASREFGILNIDGKYFLYSPKLKKFASLHQSWNLYMFNDRGIALDITSDGSGNPDGSKLRFFAHGIGSEGYNKWCLNNNNSGGIVLNTYTTAEGGNTVSIEEVENGTLDIDAAMEVFNAAPDYYDMHKVYNITNVRVTKWTANSENSGLTGTKAYAGASDEQQQFAFFKYNDRQYLYNVGAKKFVAKDGSLTTNKGDAATIGVWYTSNDSYPYCFFIEDRGLLFNGQGGGGFAINAWNSSLDDGNRHNIVEVAGVDVYDEILAYFEIPSWDVTYNIYYNGEKIGEEVRTQDKDSQAELSSAWNNDFVTLDYSVSTISTGVTSVDVTVNWNGPTLYPDYESIVWKNLYVDRTYEGADGSKNYLANTGNPPAYYVKNPTDKQRASDAYQWGFVGNPYKLKVYNKLAGPTQTLHPDNTIGMADGDSYWSIKISFNSGFMIGKTGNTNSFINQSGGYDGTNMGYWSSTSDYGNVFKEDDVPEIPLTNVYYDITFNDKVAHTVSVAGLEIGEDVPEMPTVTLPEYTKITAPNIEGKTVTENMHIEVPAIWEGPFELSADVATAHWYDMAIRSTWYVTSDNKDGDGALKTVNANALGLGEDAYHWAFVGDPWHIQVFNKAEANNFGYPKKANQGVPSFETDTYYWTIKASTSGIKNSFVMNVGGTNLYINQYGGAGGSLKFWDSGNNISDGGSAFTVFDIPTDYAEYVATEITPSMESTAKYFVLKPAVAATVGYDAAYKESCTFDQYKAMKQALMAIDMKDLNNFVLPETGYYILKNKNYGTYMGIDPTDANLYGNYQTATAAKQIVLLTKNNDNTYTIGLAGKFAPATVEQSQPVTASTEAGTYTVSIPTVGYAAFQADTENNMSVLHCAGGGSIVGWEAPAAASQWEVIDAAGTEIELTVGEAGYATMYLPCTVTAPEGVTVYTAKITEKDNYMYLALNTLNSAIPAETGVILKADAGTYKFSIVDPNIIGMPQIVNDLQGTLAPIEATGKYVLAKPEGKEVGFYLADKGNIAAGKAFIALDGKTGPLVKGFFFAEEDATAIANVNVNDNDNQAAIYNVAGQRINKLQKGINIVNGKKVLK
jgi:hypothetical protein